jgi:hypothetical protein
MTHDNPSATYSSPSDLERLTDLTSRYARYSRSAGGLSSVVGGLLCALTFVVGAVVPLDQGLRYALACAPLLWVATKEGLRYLYYQRAGAAVERLSDKHRRARLWMTIYLAAISALIIGGVFNTAMKKGQVDALMQWPAVGYLIIVATLPFIARRWFWSVSDFLVGVLLFCQAAVVLGGVNYPQPWILIAVGFSVVAIATGLREHREYFQLRDELGLSGSRR